MLYCGDLGISRSPIAKLSIASELPVRRRHLRALIREQVEITMTYEITRIYEYNDDDELDVRVAYSWCTIFKQAGVFFCDISGCFR